MRKIKNLVTFCAVGAVLFSCQTEDPVQELNNSDSKAFKPGAELVLMPKNSKSAEVEMSENMRDIFEAVAESECGPTAFRDVAYSYLVDLYYDGDGSAYAVRGLYNSINQLYSFYLNDGEQYFGADGDYTKLMVKRQRELEKFWKMPVTIKVNGEHTANLDNKDVWVETLSTFFTQTLEDGTSAPISKEEAAEYADYYLALNSTSSQLPENPYFATDGFAAGNRTIVMGDGLVRYLAEAGVDEGIVWTGILAHEWAHQVQFLNYPTWYPEGADPDPATATRYTELEADFLAAYYMTHKQGATYNQKRVEEFYDLFFLIGDCGFANPGHHGTPVQRERAADLGYALANHAQMQGKILTMQEAHEYFVANIAGIL